MLKFLFDTDHLTLFQFSQQTLLQRITGYPGAVAICPINMEEIVRGRLATLAHVPAGKKHVEAYERLTASVAIFNKFPLVSFGDQSETRYQMLRKQSLRVGSLDLKIAAIALTRGLTVLTRNRRDFERVPGLTVEDWSI